MEESFVIRWLTLRLPGQLMREFMCPWPAKFFISSRSHCDMYIAGSFRTKHGASGRSNASKVTPAQLRRLNLSITVPVSLAGANFELPLVYTTACFELRRDVGRLNTWSMSATGEGRKYL